METSVLGRFSAFALWAVGPWACGFLMIFAAAMVRALVAVRGYNHVDMVHGRYFVFARAHAIGVLVFSLITAGMFIVLLSKRVEL